MISDPEEVDGNVYMGDCDYVLTDEPHDADYDQGYDPIYESDYD